jgi:hypothetical protein
MDQVSADEGDSMVLRALRNWKVKRTVVKATARISAIGSAR